MGYKLLDGLLLLNFVLKKYSSNNLNLNKKTRYYKNMIKIFILHIYHANIHQTLYSEEDLEINVKHFIITNKEYYFYYYFFFIHSCCKKVYL